MAIKGKVSFLLPAIGTVFVLTLTACGDNSPDADRTTSAQDVPAVRPSIMIELPVDPTTLANAQVPLTTAAHSVPVCPWLSDASANAAVDNVMSSEPMVRRKVTASECTWNLNAGFSLRIQAVPLAEAVSPDSIMYNMDIPPVVESQTGPGNNASVLLDPTWDADNPRPFAFVFNIDNRQFTIRTTGVKTSAGRLRAVAEEIVAALPNAPVIAEAHNEAASLNPCVYDGATIAALFGGAAGDSFNQTPSLPGSSCKYSGIAGETGVELTIKFGGHPKDPPNIADPEYVLSDKFGSA